MALVGASPRPGTFGYRLVQEVDKGGGDLVVHLVNPRYDEMHGRPCVPTLDDIPEPVDLVLLGVPNAVLDEQLTRAASRGDRSAVIYASGYEEPQPDRQPLTARLAALAREAGMALCGGGCMGFVNLISGVRALGFAEADEIPRGPVAFVTHSGSGFSAVLRNRRGIGFTLAVSSGQELVTTTADYLHYALDLPGTRLIALMVETLRAPDALRTALDRAVAQDVPVVALTVGRSQPGRQMVTAHSGALAGSDGAWEALFDAHGVVRVRDLDEMADTLELFGSGRRAGPGGVATVHDSGAERALVVDIAHDLRVPFAAIGSQTVQKLGALLDPGLEPTNPLDAWGTGADTRELFGSALKALAADPATAVVALGVDLVPEFDGDDSYPLAAVDALAATEKPVAVLSNMASSLSLPSAQWLRARDVPVLEGTASGLAALRHLLEYRDARDRRAAETSTSAPDSERAAYWTKLLRSGPLSGADALALLGAYGLSVTPAVCAASVEEALAAAVGIGWPVVLKVDRSDLPHKSDVGGVRLGIGNADSLRVAYNDLSASLGPNVVVAAMAEPGVELALGLTRDPLLGPLVVVAAGGVLVEVLDDKAFALPPVDRAGAHRLLDRLRIRRLLNGVRGTPPADLDAIADAVVAISCLAQELGDELAAVDVNPLVCGPSGAIAVDALVVADSAVS